jgi:hypothetical protein
MTEKRFNQWVVLDRVKRDYYLCRCDCGTEKVVFMGNLRSGKSKSCGCLRDQLSRLHNITHGMSYSDEYKIWHGMRTRCKNPNAIGFANYGAAGIIVCERWDNSFNAFYEDMGPRPSKDHSVDRINNEGNYEPGNCRWATGVEQSNNTSRNVFITHEGKTMTTAEFARLTGFTPLTVYRWVTRDKLTSEQISRKLVARQRANGNKRARCSASDTHPA